MIYMSEPSVPRHSFTDLSNIHIGNPSVSELQQKHIIVRSLDVNHSLIKTLLDYKATIVTKHDIISPGKQLFHAEKIMD